MELSISRSDNEVSIIIPGEPISQGRMRFVARRGGIPIVFDPNSKEKSQLKRQFEYALKKDHPNYTYPQNPIVTFLFFMPIPQSLNKSEKEKASKGYLRQQKKPDIDNLIKFYLDCMNEIVIDDDRKVALGSAFKVYHTNPRTQIVIKESSESYSP